MQGREGAFESTCELAEPPLLLHHSADSFDDLRLIHSDGEMYHQPSRLVEGRTERTGIMRRGKVNPIYPFWFSVHF